MVLPSAFTYLNQGPFLFDTPLGPRYYTLYMDSLRKKQQTPKQLPSSAENIQPITAFGYTQWQSYEEPDFSAEAELESNSAPYKPQTEEPVIDAIEKRYQYGKRIRKISSIALFIITGLLLSFGAYLIWKTYSVSKKVSLNPQQHSFSSDVKSVVASFSENHKPLNGESEGRINILLLGAAGEKKPGKNLTDTIMVMSIDTKSNKVGFLSLPRDLYVPIPNTKSFTKINGIYQYGLANNQGSDLIKQTVEQVTGIPIHYFVVADFDGFTKIIDDIGGINVMVQRDIYDARYPGPNYSYETFEIKKGLHKLDGATALKYVRERHDDPEGDFGRAKRQQQVLQSVKNKIFSMQTLFNVIAINNMLNTVGDNIKTDISFDDLNGFLELSKKLDTQNISNVVVDAWKKDSLLKVSHVMLGNARAFILIPRVGNYSAIHDEAANLFDHDAIAKRKKEIENEKASIAIINESGDTSLLPKIKSVLSESLSLSNIVSQTNSRMMREKTVVIDNTDGKKIYTLDELLKKLPAIRASETTNTKADFTIIIGSDLRDVYRYEEDSIDDFNNAQDNQELFDIITN